MIDFIIKIIAWAFLICCFLGIFGFIVMFIRLAIEPFRKHHGSDSLPWYAWWDAMD